jgi:hypothetical protein
MAANSADDSGTIVFLFFAERDKTRKEFDASVSRSDTNSAVDDSGSRSTNSSKVDDRVKAKVATRENEDVHYGDRAGKSSETVARDQSVQGRLVSSNVSDRSDSSESRSTSQRSQQSSGVVVRSASEYTREISRPDKLDAALKEIFLTAKIVNLADYADIEGCSATAPPMDQIESDLRGLRADQSLALPQGTRAKVIASLRECAVPYLATAVAKLGIPDVDPTSGMARISVDVTAQILNVRGAGLPKTIGSVTRQIFGVGADDAVATANALTAAARAVGQETLNMLSVRGAL